MAFGLNDARYEEAVARAHRSVWTASQAAGRAGREGEQLDLEMILRELQRLGEDALKRGRRKVTAQGLTE